MLLSSAAYIMIRDEATTWQQEKNKTEHGDKICLFWWQDRSQREAYWVWTGGWIQHKAFGTNPKMVRGKSTKSEFTIQSVHKQQIYGITKATQSVLTTPLPLYGLFSLPWSLAVQAGVEISGAQTLHFRFDDVNLLSTGHKKKEREMRGGEAEIKR